MNDTSTHTPVAPSPEPDFAQYFRLLGDYARKRASCEDILAAAELVNPNVSDTDRRLSLSEQYQSFASDYRKIADEYYELARKAAIL